MQARLTAALVRSLTQQLPPKRETTVFDTLLPRFALRLRPPPAPDRPWPSMYFVRYVAPDGRERKLQIGSPATMDLDAARKAARAMLAVVDRGGDPAAEKAAKRARLSLRQAADLYLASCEFLAKGAQTQNNERAAFRLHVVHHLGHLPLADIIACGIE